MPRILPKELVSLVHHIELNKAGWWNKAIQQLIVFIMWREGNLPIMPSDITDKLRTEFNVSIDSIKVQEQINCLIRERRIVRLHDGSLKLSESVFGQIPKLIHESEMLEQKIMNKFTALVEKFCPSLNASQVWSDFRDNFLIRFVSDMGAYVFHLIAQETSVVQLELLGKDYFKQFISKYSEQKLKDLVMQFLDPRDVSVRSYILRMMNACFYIEAIGLKEETLKSLIKIYQHKPSFQIFVDTNFLFSILNLHDNPSNEAAKALMELAKKLPSQVRIKFYVAPITIQEAQRVLLSIKRNLEGIRMTSNLLESTESVDFSGIVRRFFEICKQNPSLDVESYFDPYLNNLLEITRANGVELYNQKMDHYKMKQEVIDDIEKQRQIEIHRGDRAKSYEALEHDMILWHFVKDLRPVYTESPLEAKYWIVTVDYRFIAFDRSKGNNVPICIHPTALIQMLQFWVPRTLKLEEALFTSLRLPLFFSEFDTEAEKVTIAILRTLSRFEKIEDLPVETVIHLLVNESLRTKMRSTSEEEQQIKLIKEALIDEQARLKRELEEKKQYVVKMEKDIHNLEKALEEERRMRRQLEHELQQAQREISELKEKMQVEEDRRRKEEKLRMVKRFLIWWVAVLPPTLLLIGFIIALMASFFIKLSLKIWAITIDGILLLFWLWLIDYKARKLQIEHPLVEKMQNLKHWIWGVLLAGILVNALWDMIKALLR